MTEIVKVLHEAYTREYIVDFKSMNDLDLSRYCNKYPKDKKAWLEWKKRTSVLYKILNE